MDKLPKKLRYKKISSYLVYISFSYISVWREAILYIKENIRYEFW